MEPKKSTTPLVVWILCAVFFFSVLCMSVMGIPEFWTDSDRPAQTTVTLDESFGKVNLNTGLKEEFLTLPGIGEVMAERIIAYREENGPFGSVEDLLNVKGIGEKTLEKLRELITV